MAAKKSTPKKTGRNTQHAPGIQFLTKRQLAEKLGVCAMTVQRMARSKLIPSYALGRSIRFNEQEVLAALVKNVRVPSI